MFFFPSIYNRLWEIYGGTNIVKIDTIKLLTIHHWEFMRFDRIVCTNTFRYLYHLISIDCFEHLSGYIWGGLCVLYVSLFNTNMYARRRGGVILEQKSWIELDFWDVTCRLFYSHQCTLLKRQTEQDRMSITSELLKMPCLPVIWVMDMGAKILCSGTTEHLVNRSIKDDQSTGVGNKYLYAWINV